MKLRRSVYAFVALVVLVVAGTGLVTLRPIGASAGQSGVLDDGKDLLPLASITLDQAIAAAQGAAAGAVDEVDLEYWHGKLVFNVDVGNQDVKVDAGTGQVLEFETDD
jgi:hypothetical protein